MNIERREQLNRIVIKGFKSIKECELDLNNINVLIGANGAGKSNFISILKMLQRIIKGELSMYASKKGANSLFYNGAKVTDSITAEFYFGDYIYSFDIEMGDNNSLTIVGESVGETSSPLSDGGYSESKLLEWRNNSRGNAIAIRSVLGECWRTYHFQDTSQNAKIKTAHNVSDSVFLHKDASNLAAFLLRLKTNYPEEYANILRTVQRIAPYFKDFVWLPEEKNNELIFLRWQEKGCDEIFNPSQLSDGTLRFICLATLLLQPTTLQPATIIIDEPELGLHPYAITIFAELVKKIATRKQIILATQSTELLDHFDAEDVIVVDRSNNGSEFKRLDAEKLVAWLEDDYSLSELWNKNLFGGRVSR
ncbi:MAG: AAA family ATPase [Clostridiales bacterium]|jgi:predicted ATPase|nr:AAA family ATPase [Clostridiales bacterium]